MARFFISGCQRSGTTLMALLLESHPNIHCFDEGTAYELLANRRAAPETGDKLVGYKIPIWTEQLLEAMLDGNELSLITDFGRVPNFYSGERILFLVRNPVDTVTSMVQLKFGGDSWLDRIGIPVVENQLCRPQFAAAFKEEIELALSSEHRAIAFGALYWKFKTCALLKYQNAQLPILAVSYEQLVTRPRPIMQGVLTFLGVAWNESVLSHHTHPHLQVVDGKAIGNTDPRRPIDESSVGHWNGILTSPQVEIIQRITKSLQEKLSAEASI